MKLNIGSKLRDFTKKFKINEETYVNKYKELVGDENKYQTSNDDNKNSNNNFINDQVLMDNKNDILQKRDKEISTLLTSINELASIFKDLQTLVLEQGTILDRIDYNIDNAVQSTKQATEELRKADKNMKSNCARNANMVLMFVIFVFSVLLLLKFVK
jgi:syntaxin 16